MLRSEPATVGDERDACPSDETSRESAGLVDRLIAHDEAAFEELVRMHGPRMLAVAMRHLHRRADAEDALQDAFVNVVRFISRFERASRLETWLHRIVVNCALMILRRKRRRPESTFDASTLEGRGAEPWRRRPDPLPPEALVQEEMRRVVRLGIEGLREVHRSILVLHDLGSLEPEELSTLLHVGVPGVKTRITRARHALRDAVGRRLAPAAR